MLLVIAIEYIITYRIHNTGNTTNIVQFLNPAKFDFTFMPIKSFPVSRCARYDAVPTECSMVTSPRDSCCLVPSCPPVPKVTPSPMPGASTTYMIPTAPPGEVTGAANIPTPGPGQTPQPISKYESSNLFTETL